METSALGTYTLATNQVFLRILGSSLCVLLGSFVLHKYFHYIAFVTPSDNDTTQLDFKDSKPFTHENDSQISRTYRVRGLKHLRNVESWRKATAAWLRQEINENLTHEERKIPIIERIRIVPHWDDVDESEALVTFSQIPLFLRDLEIDFTKKISVEYVTDKTFHDEMLFFDCNFHGLTQLYFPTSNDNITADIIAITGVDGHAWDSWKGEDEEDNVASMWLCDFLQKDLPNCRTMIFGYHAEAQTHLRPLEEYGDQLEEMIRVSRKTEEERKRPLIFVAHCTGGIIASRVLVTAFNKYCEEDSDPTNRAVYNAIYGYIFLGTPHRGLTTDNMQTMFGLNHNTQLSKTLGTDLPLIRHIFWNFKNVLNKRKIVSYYEQRDTMGMEMIEKEGKMKYERTGTPAMIIDKERSTLGIPEEECKQIDRDHYRMIKFDSRYDDAYISVKSWLQTYERDATQTVAIRFRKEDGLRTDSEIYSSLEDNMKDVRSLVEEAQNNNFHHRFLLEGLEPNNTTYGQVLEEKLTDDVRKTCETT